MDIDTAKPWDVEDLLGQDLTKGRNNINIRINFPQILNMLLLFDPDRLIDRDVMLKSTRLYF